MIRQKRSIKEWAKEICRCEAILENELSTSLEVERAEWKINSIMSLFAEDPENLIFLVLEVEKLIFETLDKDK